jgi:hypothetical protein
MQNKMNWRNNDKHNQQELKLKNELKNILELPSEKLQFEIIKNKFNDLKLLGGEDNNEIKSKNNSSKTNMSGLNFEDAIDSIFDILTGQKMKKYICYYKMEKRNIVYLDTDILVNIKYNDFFKCQEENTDIVSNDSAFSGSKIIYKKITNEATHDNKCLFLGSKKKMNLIRSNNLKTNINDVLKYTKERPDKFIEHFQKKFPNFKSEMIQIYNSEWVK